MLKIIKLHLRNSDNSDLNVTSWSTSIKINIFNPVLDNKLS